MDDIPTSDGWMGVTHRIDLSSFVEERTRMVDAISRYIARGLSMEAAKLIAMREFAKDEVEKLFYLSTIAQERGLGAKGHSKEAAMKKIKIAWYCKCGAFFSGVGPESMRTRLETAAAVFHAGHEGDGHGATDSKGAEAARQSADRMTIRAVA